MLPEPESRLPVKEIAKYLTGAVLFLAALGAGFLDLRDGHPTGLGVGEVGGLLFISGILIDPALTKDVLAQGIAALKEFFGRDHG